MKPSRSASLLTASPVLLAAFSLFAITMPVRAAAYPIDSHGSIAVDLVRHFDATGFTSSVAVANNQFILGLNTPASFSINGGGQKTQWQVTDTTQAASSLQITLDQIYSINQIVAHPRLFAPSTFDVLVSDTGFGSMTTIATGVSAHTGDNPFYFPAQPVKFVQINWHGAPSGFVDIQRVSAYQAASAGGIRIFNGFNLRGAITPTITNASVGAGGWADALSHLYDGDLESFLRGNGSGQDARVVMDLGSVLPVHNVTLGFYDDQSWTNGSTVELSADGVNYTTIFDSTSGGTTNITIPGHIDAQFIRLTDKKSSDRAIVEIEVELIPEPASAAMLTLGAVGLLARRRRK